MRLLMMVTRIIIDRPKFGVLDQQIILFGSSNDSHYCAAIATVVGVYICNPCIAMTSDDDDDEAA